MRRRPAPARRCAAPPWREVEVVDRRRDRDRRRPHRRRRAARPGAARSRRPARARRRRPRRHSRAGRLPHACRLRRRPCRRVRPARAGRRLRADPRRRRGHRRQRPRHPRRRRRRARWAELLDRHLAWMAARGHDHRRGQVRLRPRPRHRAGHARRRRRRGHPIEVAPTFLGAHAVRPRVGRRRRLPRLRDRARCCPQAAGRAEAADVFLERGAFDRDQAERYLRAAAEHGLALRLHADQFSEAGGVAPRRRAGRALGRPPRGDRPRRASRRWRPATWRPCCCPRA